jgi:hypothetical protein
MDLDVWPSTTEPSWSVVIGMPTTLRAIENTLRKPLPAQWERLLSDELHAAFRSDLVAVAGIEAALDSLGHPAVYRLQRHPREDAPRPQRDELVRLARAGSAGCACARATDAFMVRHTSGVVGEGQLDYLGPLPSSSGCR